MSMKGLANSFVAFLVQISISIDHCISLDSSIKLKS